MTDLAQHIRIFDKEPTDELVEKRSVAIKAMAAAFRELSAVGEILQLAADLTAGMAKGGALSDGRTLEAEKIIRETSSSFVRQGQDMQILTCTYLAVLEILSTTTPSSGIWSRSDVLALGLWSGLSLQTPRPEQRLEALRIEVLDAARELVQQSSMGARTRQQISDVEIKMPAAFEPTAASQSIKTGIAPAIEALQTNAALDREELDLLWWILSDWSTLAKKSFSAMGGTTAVICAALEAGRLLRRLPSDSHKHMMLRHLKKDQKVSLKKLLEDIGQDGTDVAKHVGNGELFAGRETIFPFVSACIKPPIDKDRVLPISEWAAHALLESAILHLGTLPRKLI